MYGSSTVAFVGALVATVVATGASVVRAAVVGLRRVFVFVRVAVRVAVDVCSTTVSDGVEWGVGVAVKSSLASDAVLGVEVETEASLVSEGLWSPPRDTDSVWC